MRFIFDGVCHKVSRITGPTHNFLSLRLEVGKGQGEIQIEKVKLSGEASLDEVRVVDEVLAGVEEANQCYGTSFVIVALQFVENDSGPETVYKFLALSIVERLASGLPFTEVPPKV